MHRDISAGNILICPRVEADEDGVLRVKWRGMLADWELSKRIADKESEEKARQIVRTVCSSSLSLHRDQILTSCSQGTWQFASAYILDNPEKPVRIADELESFFHVTLYHALRYLRHNCGEVQATMFDFFDWYSVHKDGYRCGSEKRSTMENGVFRQPGTDRGFTFYDDDDLASGQPLNAIFEIMLSWFSARYKRLKAAVIKDPNVQVSRRLLQEAYARHRRPEVLREHETEADSQPAAQPLEVDSHAEFLTLLDIALEMHWPEEDVVGDQLKKKPIPGPDFLSPDTQAGAGDQIEANAEAASQRDPEGDVRNHAVMDGENGNDGEGDPDRDPEEPTAKRRRSQTDMKGQRHTTREQGEATQGQHPHPPPLRTRGSRTTRGYGSRTASMYQLRSGRS